MLALLCMWSILRFWVSTSNAFISTAAGRESFRCTGHMSKQASPISKHTGTACAKVSFPHLGDKTGEQSGSLHPRGVVPFLALLLGLFQIHTLSLALFTYFVSLEEIMCVSEILCKTWTFPIIHKTVSPALVSCFNTTLQSPQFTVLMQSLNRYWHIHSPSSAQHQIHRAWRRQSRER